MRTPTLDTLLHVAVRAAQSGGAVVLQHFNKITWIKNKDDDPHNRLTIADLTSEEHIVSTITRAFPEHRIIAEERGDNARKSDYTWVIDPLDATSNFIQGIPYFTVSIAVFKKNRPVVGVLFHPSTKELFVSVRGKGAFLNGRRIHVSRTAALHDAIGGYGAGHANARLLRVLTTVVPSTQRMRLLGCPSLQAAYVAAGRLDFAYLIHLHLHDLAAAMLIVKEAGGMVSTTIPHLTPDMKDRFDLIASNRRVHRALTPFLKQRKK